ncbi:MAG: HNH endonuclease [Patescibacteria group bacterium]|nr:HNH endonuclease [Patescibacteria group bacterium]
MTEITRDNWECGHIVSVKNGGSDAVDNLRPVCKKCNGSMGEENMFEFAYRNGFQKRWPDDKGFTETSYAAALKKHNLDETAKKADAKSGSGAMNRVERKVPKGRAAAKMDEDDEVQPGMAARVDAEIAKLTPGDVTVLTVDGEELLAFMKGAQNYEHNRAVDTKRVERMIRYYKDDFVVNGVYDLRSTPFGVCLTPSGSTLQKTMIDGAHRTELVRALGDPKSVRALLWVKRCRTKEQVADEFFKMNCGTPVPASYYSMRTAAVVNEFIDQVEGEYPGQARTTATAKRPTYKRDEVVDILANKLRDQILDGEVNAEMLYAKFTDLNTEAYEKFDGMTPEEQKAEYPEKGLIGNVEASGFYIGLMFGRTWADKLAEGIKRDLRRAARASSGDKKTNTAAPVKNSNSPTKNFSSPAKSSSSPAKSSSSSETTAPAKSSSSPAKSSSSPAKSSSSSETTAPAKSSSSPAKDTAGRSAKSSSSGAAAKTRTTEEPDEGEDE